MDGIILHCVCYTLAGVCHYTRHEENQDEAISCRACRNRALGATGDNQTVHGVVVEAARTLIASDNPDVQVLLWAGSADRMVAAYKNLYQSLAPAQALTA